MNIGTSAFGLRLPIIKQGDNLPLAIKDSLFNAFDEGEYIPQNGDIIGITESIIARSEGRYVSVDDIVLSLKKLFPDNSSVIVYNPIFSRNRFSLILKAIARYFNKIHIFVDQLDEVGNYYNHNITKVNYYEYYTEICEHEEGKECEFHYLGTLGYHNIPNLIDCTLHSNLFEYPDIFTDFNWYSLKDICNDVSEWGLLGSNKAGTELLKLFPDSKSQQMIDYIKVMIEKAFNISNVNVIIYGDGCYKDATSGIWEFADPVVSPAYTEGLNGTPSELKLKYLADEEFGDLADEELEKAIKERIANKNVVQGRMETQGTTPRRYTDLLGSLMDLISGSGDKGTPVVIVQNYFKNYSE